jgi:hypothetical protein
MENPTNSMTQSLQKAPESVSGWVIEWKKKEKKIQRRVLLALQAVIIINNVQVCNKKCNPGPDIKWE